MIKSSVSPSSVPGKLRAHIPSLDGLRGMAVLLVIVHHFAEHQEVGTGATKIFFRFCEAGWAGVDLFFVLSGFLITGILQQARNQNSPIRTFYARRTLRIFPLYYLSLVLIIFVWPALSASPESFVNIQQNQAWYWTYLVNVLVVLKVPMGEVNAAHFWSLAVEEQFYMVWPFVVLFVSDKNLRRVCLGMIVGAFCFRLGTYLMGWGHGPAYVLTISRVDSLGAGALVATLLRDPKFTGLLEKYALRLLFGFLIAYALVVVFQGSFRRGPLMLTLGFTALSGLFAMLIAIAAREKNNLVRQIFEQGFLRFFGKYSYAMYIVHPFVLVWINTWFSGFVGNGHVYSSGLPRFAIFTFVGLTVTSIAALLSWNLFERWFLDLKKYFEPKPRPVADARA